MKIFLRSGRAAAPIIADMDIAGFRVRLSLHL